jgi:hypothetical protein
VAIGTGGCGGQWAPASHLVLGLQEVEAGYGVGGAGDQDLMKCMCMVGAQRGRQPGLGGSWGCRLWGSKIDFPGPLLLLLPEASVWSSVELLCPIRVCLCPGLSQMDLGCGFGEDCWQLGSTACPSSSCLSAILVGAQHVQRPRDQNQQLRLWLCMEWR